MRGSTRIAEIAAGPLDVPMREPFAIAGGETTAVRNALVRVRLASGIVGWGEAAPLAAFNGETQAQVLREVAAAADRLVGRDVADWRPVLEAADDLLAGSGAARAALGTAIVDAATRAAGTPLRRLFGGASASVRSDVTVALVDAEAARRSARRIVRLGVDTIKVKVGAGIDEDEARVRAVAAAAPRARLLLDANQAFTAGPAIRLVRCLRRAGIAPVLFEQPVARDDWQGLADVHRLARIRVAADESVATRADAVALAARGCAQVVNVKLMKSGILAAWEIAVVARAAGLGLMIGAMVESPLAMTAAAHLAAGLGGFEFVDLDTSLWFARDPMRGVRFGRGGLYDLRVVRAGVGVVPRAAWSTAVANGRATRG
ncbi:MAG TPA: dipeptide epimerase [Candidatus Binatia bacterium]|nr:dipeptide epimerase [Candidatus Binatia bacterium]